MASTYSQIKNGLDEISGLNSKYRKAVINAREALIYAQSGLISMQTAYTSLVADINAAVAANPGNQAYIVAGAEKDLLVADFLSLKSWVDTLIIAFDGVSE